MCQMLTFIVALRNYHVKIDHKNKVNSPSDLKRIKKKYNIDMLGKISKQLKQQTYQCLTGGLVY